MAAPKIILAFNITTAVPGFVFSPHGDVIALNPVAAAAPRGIWQKSIEWYVCQSGAAGATSTFQWQTSPNNAAWTNIGTAFSLATGTALAAKANQVLSWPVPGALGTGFLLRLNVTAISAGRIDAWALLKGYN